MQKMVGKKSNGKSYEKIKSLNISPWLAGAIIGF